ncbi:TonB-dependent receptor [Sphingomonas naphthae]|uniref:TonB-dependent receptor n=1 Tax=Sphingomonas naphthae TaxID=1813468 RepID=A0ABY7TQV4_9SPHN|nr:TonB-dependent receptor [Sphingomonas naphthae]WCT74755.1 TonB-dependent receptor [Sphingomonas naphthae]
MLRKALVALMTLPVALAATAAYAEEAPVAAAAAEEPAPEEQGGDIVVTAQRRSSTLVSTPVSVQAFSALKLEEQSVSHLYDISKVTPGLRMDLLGTNLQPTIRGITTATSGTGNSMNTAIYMDGYYQPSNLSNGLDLADISQIEVVKGPQGTLFGRNATAGAILITTRDPSYDFHGKLEAGYGSYNDYRGNAFLTGGLTDTLAASASVVYRHFDGFTRNVINNERQGYYHSFLGRGKIMFEPSSMAKFVLQARYSKSNDPEGRIYRVVGRATTGFSIPGTIVTTQKYRNSQGLQPKSETKVGQVTLTSSFDFDWATLTSYTGGMQEKTSQQTDLDGTSARISDIISRTNTKTFSQEFILGSKGGGRLDWTLGANYFYQWDDAPFYTIGTLTNGTFANTRSSRVTTNAFAAFADATWEPIDHLFLTGGVRYSSERKDYVFGLTTRTTDTDKKWTQATPRAVIRYELAPRTNVYASFSKGFKSGTFNASSASATPVNPEKITAWESGFKTAGDMFSLNTAAYFYKYSDMQLSSYNFLANPPITMLQNVGRAEIYGGEVEAQIRPSPNFRVSFNGAYTHARYKEFPGAIAYVPNATNTAYATVTRDNSGSQMMRAPTWTGTLSTYYQVPTSAGTFAVSPSLYVTSDFFTEAATQFPVDGYAVLDLTTSFTLPGDKIKISAVVKNVFDRYYISYWDPVGSALMIADAPPRTVRVSVAFKF